MIKKLYVMMTMMSLLASGSFATEKSTDQKNGKQKGFSIKGRIHTSLPEFEFKVTYDYEAGQSTIREILVQETYTKKTVQRIQHHLGDTVSDQIPPLRLVDSNSDGYLDLRILTVCGNKQCDERCWLFDRIAKQFVYSNELSTK